MARALRVISAQRGLDPRDFVLTSFGGAGGLHVCALAEALGITRALVPVHAGVLSALGMVVTPAGRTLTRTRLGLLAEAGDAEIESAFVALVESGIAELEQEGLARERLRVEHSLDLRYRGQSHTLNLSWDGVAETMSAFHAQHRDRYGHRLDLPVELVNLRVRVRGPTANLALPPIGTSGRDSPTGSVNAYGCRTPVTCWTREDLGTGHELIGPAIIADALATTWLAPGWRADLDAVGNLMLQRAVRIRL
jgi:N-methylhydantoinase A